MNVIETPSIASETQSVIGKEMKYDVFFSYSSLDEHYVSQIQKSIQRIGLPFYNYRGNLKIYNYRFDADFKANSYEGEILPSLDQSKKLIVFASRNSNGSPKVKAEIEHWHKAHRNPDNSIADFLFISLDDILNSNGIEQTFANVEERSLPLFKLAIYNKEPLWANLVPYCYNGKIEKNHDSYKIEIAKIKGWILKKDWGQIYDRYKLLRRIARISVFVLILIIYKLAKYVESKRIEANKASSMMTKTKEELSKEIFDRNLNDATFYIDGEEPCFALRSLKAADSIASDTSRNKNIVQQDRIKVEQLIDSLNKLQLPCQE